MRRHTVTVLVAALVLVLLAGCGGGGGPAPTPPSPDIRLIQPGDQWSYNMSGTLSAQGQTVRISGTMTDTVYDLGLVSPSGQMCLSQQRVLNYTANGQQYVETFWLHFAQPGGGRSLYTYGTREGGSDSWYTSPVDGYLDTRSPVVVGDQHSQTVTSPGEPAETRTWRVKGTESVSVPAGRFTAYVIETTVDGATGTGWFVPSLGHKVKRDMVSTVDYQGTPVTANLSLSLRSYDTSVPPSATGGVTGRIVDVVSLQGIGNMTITIGGQQGVSQAPDGSFIISNIIIGNHQVVVTPTAQFVPVSAAPIYVSVQAGTYTNLPDPIYVIDPNYIP